MSQDYFGLSSLRWIRDEYSTSFCLIGFEKLVFKIYSRIFTNAYFSIFINNIAYVTSYSWLWYKCKRSNFNDCSTWKPICNKINNKNTNFIIKLRKFESFSKFNSTILFKWEFKLVLGYKSFKVNIRFKRLHCFLIIVFWVKLINMHINFLDIFQISNYFHSFIFGKNLRVTWCQIKNDFFFKIF